MQSQCITRLMIGLSITELEGVYRIPAFVAQTFQIWLCAIGCLLMTLLGQLSIFNEVTCVYDMT